MVRYYTRPSEIEVAWNWMLIGLLIAFPSWILIWFTEGEGSVIVFNLIFITLGLLLIITGIFSLATKCKHFKEIFNAGFAITSVVFLFILLYIFVTSIIIWYKLNPPTNIYF